jgi:hypothetical protein
MLKNISRTQLAGSWIAAVIVLMACSVVAGADITVGAGELWLTGTLVPPAIMLLLWHRTPTLTVAELLYAVNKRS